MWALFCINPRTRLSCQHRRVFMSASERDRVEDLSSRVLLRMPIYQPECGRWPGLSCSTSSACQNHHRWSSFQLHSSSVQMPLWMPSSWSGTFRLHAGVGERAGRKGGCPKLISKVRGVSELFASKYLRVWSTKCQLEREVREKKTARKKKEEGKRWEKGDKWGVNKRDERGEITSSPVLVESSLALITQMLGKDGLQGPHATRSLHITHHPNHHQWRRLNNGYWLHHFMLMALWMEEIRCSTEINILQSLLFFTAYLILDGSFLVRCGSFLPCSPCRRWDDKAWTDHL